MKRIIFTLIAVVLCTLTLLPAQTIVEKHGLLKVKDAHVVDKDDQFISLCGNSLFWSLWGGERFYNSDVVKFLKEDWNSSIVRAAMAVDEDGGYIYDPAGQIANVKTVVDACIDNGLYVIIDFHSHHAENYTTQAITFFQEMARTYGTYDNVIYEIYNEPIYLSWSSDIKPYAQKVINAIREIDPDNLIIVGTPFWSQSVVEASLDPINANNIAYTLHFYADTHQQDLRNAAQSAMNNGIAIFITEWGTCDASGNGGYNETASNDWMSFCKDNFISLCNWAINDKEETASALKPGASINGGWTDADYTVSGTYVRNQMLNWPTSGSSCNIVSLPNTIRAEHYCRQFGVQRETCNEGGQNVGYIDAGDWMTYPVTVAVAGNYTVSYRVASQNGGGKMQLDTENGTVVFGVISVPSTGGWQDWTTITHDITLPAGTYDFRILALTGGFNINWLEFTCETVGTPILTKITLSPSDRTIDINTSLQLTAQGFDQNNNPLPVTPVWSIDKAGAAIDQNGNFTAGETTGIYTVTVTQENVTASVEITVIDPCPPKIIAAGRIEAEDYCTAFNIDTEVTEDIGGGVHVGWLSNGSWLTYKINVPETGVYALDFRVASLNTEGNLKIIVDGIEVQTESFPITGGWQVFRTISTTIHLTEGNHELKFAIVVGAFNINWFEFKNSNATKVTHSIAGLLSEIYPNPVCQGDILHLSVLPAVNYIRMTDLRGVVVYTQSVNDKIHDLTIPTDGLAGGIYLLQLVSDQNQKVYKIIVK